MVVLNQIKESKRLGAKHSIGINHREEAETTGLLNTSESKMKSFSSLEAGAAASGFHTGGCPLSIIGSLAHMQPECLD